jgi:hypothetical protein
MNEEIQTLVIHALERNKDGDPELPVGGSGIWEFVHAISEGAPARMVIAAQTDLATVGDAFGIMQRACELAAALGRLPDAGALAQAVKDELASEVELHGGGHDCEAPVEDQDEHSGADFPGSGPTTWF